MIAEFERDRRQSLPETRTNQEPPRNGKDFEVAHEFADEEMRPVATNSYRWPTDHDQSTLSSQR
jgi:hypothetical protein